MKKVGRGLHANRYKLPPAPTKYKPEYCEAIIESGMKGWTFKEFASSIDVVYDTLREWCEKHKEFKWAFARAKQEQENFLMRLGRNYGLTGRKGGKTKKGQERRVPWFNTAVWIFMLKARHGWRENDMVVDEDETEMEFTE